MPQVGHGIRQPVWARAVHGGSSVTSLVRSGGVNAVAAGSGAPVGSVTLLRLLGLTPVVLICAPASMTSARRAMRLFRAWVSPVVSTIPVLVT